MSQQNWNTPPPGQGYPQVPGFGQAPGQPQWGGPPPAPRQNNTIWWVLIGIAVVALGGILLYALLGGGDSPSVPSQPQTTGPQDPGAEEPGPDPGSISVASAAFPDSLGGYTKDSEESFEGQGILASYEGPGGLLFGTLDFSDPDTLPDVIGQWDKPQTIDGLSCGLEPPLAVVNEEAVDGIPTCAVAASDGIITVSSETIPVEQLAPLLKELVGKL